MGQFFTNGVAISYTATGSYVTCDLSASIPASATGVAIRVVKSSISNVSFGIRSFGSTDDLYCDNYGITSQSVFVKCSEQKIQIKTPSTHNMTFYLMGYFESEATFLSTRLDVTPGIYTSWQTVTLSTIPAGDCFALFEIIGTGSGSTYDRVNIRRTGSTDNRTGYDIFYSDRHYGIISGTNASKQVDIWSGGARHRAYLVGYIAAGNSDINTNAVDLSITSSTFADKDLDTFDTVPPYTICAIVEVSGNLQGTFDLRSKGSTDDFSSGVNYSGLSGDFCVLPQASTNIIEAKVQSTTIDMLLRGFIYSGPPVANFTYTPSVGAILLTVNFTDTSTNAPTSWSWKYSLNGGAYVEFSTSQNPSYVFTVSGTYSIKLTATNSQGSDDEEKLSIINVGGTSSIASISLSLFSGTGGTDGTADTMPAFGASNVLADSPGIISSLPIFLLQGGGYWTGIAGVVDLPRLTGSATSIFWINEAQASLPIFTLSGTVVTPHGIAATLPLLQAAASSLLGETALLSQLLPKLQAGTNNVMIVGFTDLTLDVTLPRILLSSSGISGNIANLSKTLPIVTISSIGELSIAISSTADLLLPILKLFGLGTSVIVPISTAPAIVLNARNNSVSRYTNYNFNSMTQYKDIGLGVKDDGIYLLSGQSDAGSLTDFELNGYIWDMGTPLQKRVTDVYLSMRANGTYVLQLQADDGSIWEAEIINSTWDMKNKKYHTPRGLKGKYWRWKLSSKAGAKFDMDSIEFSTEILKSRI